MMILNPSIKALIPMIQKNTLDTLAFTRLKSEYNKRKSKFPKYNGVARYSTAGMTKPDQRKFEEYKAIFTKYKESKVAGLQMQQIIDILSKAANSAKKKWIGRAQLRAYGFSFAGVDEQHGYVLCLLCDYFACLCLLCMFCAVIL